MTILCAIKAHKKCINMLEIQMITEKFERYSVLVWVYVRNTENVLEFVSINHWIFCCRWHLAKQQTSVNVKNGNMVIEPNSLVVSGYDTSGSVTSDGEPITGVSFVLFQQTGVKVTRLLIRFCIYLLFLIYYVNEFPHFKNFSKTLPICKFINLLCRFLQSGLFKAHFVLRLKAFFQSLSPSS